MVWGTFLQKNFPSSNGHFHDFGGSEPLPGWFGALMQWKLKLKWAFACVKEGVKACQDALCTYVPSKRRFSKFAQIGPEKKCPRVPIWVRGGVQLQFGQCPNRGDAIPPRCFPYSCNWWRLPFSFDQIWRKKGSDPLSGQNPDFFRKKKTFEGVLNRDGQILISQLNIVKDSKTSEYRSRAAADKDKKGGWIRKEIVHNK